MARLKSKLHQGRILPVFLMAFLLAVLAWPADLTGLDKGAGCEIPHLKTATVKKVHKNGILQLSNGDLVRLIGIMPVKLIEHATSPTAKRLNRLAQKAIDLMRKQVEGQQIELHQSGRRHDRYDRLLAHVYGKNGQWLQGLLLAGGLARSQSFADNHVCMKQMLKLEAQARGSQRGLWRYRIFRPQPALQPEQLLRKHFRFTLVEGRINKVASVKKWLFLNFGDNWRNDFTIAIKKKYKRKIERSGLDLEKLQGKKVRVRGWIERWNGPLIKVTHKEQIEILDEE